MLGWVEKNGRGMEDDDGEDVEFNLFFFNNFFSRRRSLRVLLVGDELLGCEWE